MPKSKTPTKAVTTITPEPAVTLSAVPPSQAWKRQPKESPQAFEAWETYMQVKGERAGGLTEVARRLNKSRTVMATWSGRWRWVERYRQYENYQIFLQEREQQRAMREGAVEWAKRRIDARDKGFELGKKLIDRANLLLDLPVANKKVTKKVIAEAAGQEIDVVTELLFQQSPRDARLMAETGLKLMRLSADMSTENIGLLPADVNLDEMDEAQLDEYARKLEELRQKQIEGGEI